MLYLRANAALFFVLVNSAFILLNSASEYADGRPLYLPAALAIAIPSR